jgi:hypothetical protein
VFFFRIQSSEVRQTQDDVGQESRNEKERKDSWPVLVVVQPFGAPSSQLQPSVDENDGRIRNSEQSSYGEHRCGDQTVCVAWFDEVKESRGDRSDIN